MKYRYQSIFKDVFNSFVEEKHNLGFDYKTEEYKLKQLDELIIKEKILEIKLTKDLIEKYIAKRSFEKKINSINRIGVARELAKFMIRKDIRLMYCHHCQEAHTIENLYPIYLVMMNLEGCFYQLMNG